MFERTARMGLYLCDENSEFSFFLAKFPVIGRRGFGVFCLLFHEEK